MPIYPYRCPMCNFTTDVIKPMRIYDREEQCPQCGAIMTREVSAPETRPFKPFFNEWLTYDKYSEGVQIDSWGDLRKHMKAAGVDFAGNKPGRPGCWV